VSTVGVLCEYMVTRIHASSGTLHPVYCTTSATSASCARFGRTTTSPSCCKARPALRLVASPARRAASAVCRVASRHAGDASWLQPRRNSVLFGGRSLALNPKP
jgi:hypothetical protein